MANRYAVASGNWSNPATWDGGTLPTTADNVRPNGFTVTIDQDITVLSLTANASTPAVGGGTFVINSGVTIAVGSIGSNSTFAVSVLTVSHSSGTVTITGGGPTSANNNAIIHSGSGHLVLQLTSWLNSTFVKTGSGNLTITLGSLSVEGSSNTFECKNTSSGNVTVTCGSMTITNSGNPLLVFSGSTCNIVWNGNVLGGNSVAFNLQRSVS